MPWYIWAWIAYFVIDRISTVLYVGRDVEITPAIALASLITGGLLIWTLVSLAA